MGDVLLPPFKGKHKQWAELAQRFRKGEQRPDDGEFWAADSGIRPLVSGMPCPPKGPPNIVDILPVWSTSEVVGAVCFNDEGKATRIMLASAGQ